MYQNLVNPSISNSIVEDIMNQEVKSRKQALWVKRIVIIAAILIVINSVSLVGLIFWLIKVNSNVILTTNGGTGLKTPPLANQILLGNGQGGYYLQSSLPVAAGGTGSNRIPAKNSVLVGNACGGFDLVSVLPIAAGGTGIKTVPAKNQVLVGNGDGFDLASALPVTAGGTGIQTVPAKNQVLLGNGNGFDLASALPVTAGGTGIQAVPAKNQVLVGNGNGFELISPLPVTAGGSGLTSLENRTNSLLCSGVTAEEPFQTIGSGLNNQVLTSNGPGKLPTWGWPSSNITIVHIQPINWNIPLNNSDPMTYTNIDQLQKNITLSKKAYIELHMDAHATGKAFLSFFIDNQTVSPIYTDRDYPALILGMGFYMSSDTNDWRSTTTTQKTILSPGTYNIALKIAIQASGYLNGILITITIIDLNE